MKSTTQFLIAGAILLPAAIWSGNGEAADTRRPVRLNETEHEFVLSEMRGFVESLQQVMSGLAAGNMKMVAEAAKRSGRRTANQAPRSLAVKFPPAFAALGAATHQYWDELAAEAEDMGDGAEIVRQLSVLLNNCTTCHAGYRLVRDAD